MHSNSLSFISLIYGAETTKVTSASEACPGIWVKQHTTVLPWTTTTTLKLQLPSALSLTYPSPWSHLYKADVQSRSGWELKPAFYFSKLMEEGRKGMQTKTSSPDVRRKIKHVCNWFTCGHMKNKSKNENPVKRPSVNWPALALQ